MRYPKRKHVLAGVLAVVVVAALGLAVVQLVGRRAPPAKPAATVTHHPSASPSPSLETLQDKALKADYTVRGKWPGGFNAELDLTNLGSEPVEGWTVRLRLPPDVKVAQAWSADVTRVPGAVELRSQPWNTYLGPGATVRMGFAATGKASAPSACTVNGARC